MPEKVWRCSKTGSLRFPWHRSRRPRHCPFLVIVPWIRFWQEQFQDDQRDGDRGRQHWTAVTVNVCPSKSRIPAKPHPTRASRTTVRTPTFWMTFLMVFLCLVTDSGRVLGNVSIPDMYACTGDLPLRGGRGSGSTRPQSLDCPRIPRRSKALPHRVRDTSLVQNPSILSVRASKTADGRNVLVLAAPVGAMRHHARGT